MRFIPLLMLLFSSASFAGDYWGTATIRSYHVNPLRDDYNEKNFGLGVEYRDGALLMTAGAYRNSANKNSVYALVGALPIEVGPLKIGGAVGLVNGYPRMNDGGIVPAALGLVALEGERVGMNVAIIPGVKSKTPLTIALQIKVKF